EQVIQLPSNIAPVEGFNARNFPAHNINDEIEPFAWDESHIAVTEPKRTNGLELGVKSSANIVPAAAPVEYRQRWKLGGKFGFAPLGQEMLKLVCELGEYIG